MVSERRIFLRRLIAGTIGFVVGNSAKGALPDPFFDRKSKKQSFHGYGEAVFPFLTYAGRYNVGEYLPKDQGGMFVQMELIGTEVDEQIVRSIRGGILEKVYGNPITWDLFEKSQIEKSVWLNRFYFLPSFARMYYLTRDTTFLKDMVNLVEIWIGKNPFLSYQETRTINWRDMQVAWRAVNWIWSYYLTKDALPAKHKKMFTDSIELHGRLLLSSFGKQELNEFNHQSHGALAMLYIGILFPEFEISDQLKHSGLKILEHHIENAFYDDGGNVEHMFGYYPFETQIFRDTYLLCINNKIPFPEKLMPLLGKMAFFISAMAQPDGTMPPVNDSFEMPVTVTEKVLNDLTGRNHSYTHPVSHFFADSQTGVYKSRNQKWYLTANAAKSIGAHSHAGRLAFTVWYEGEPLLIDSGCCNYDNPMLINWFRTSQAHNTVLIDNKSDEATSSNRLWVPRRATDNRITNWESGLDYHFCRMVSPSSDPVNSGVSWTRSLVLVKESMIILYDCFTSGDKDKHSFDLLFHFPKEKITCDYPSKSLFLSGKNPVKIFPLNLEITEDFKVSDGYIGKKGEIVAAPMATWTLKGQGLTHSIFIILPKETLHPDVSFRYKMTRQGIGLMIKGLSQEDTVVLFRHPEYPELRMFGKKTVKLSEVFQSTGF